MERQLDEMSRQGLKNKYLESLKATSNGLRQQFYFSPLDIK